MHGGQFTKLYSAALQGVDALEVEIEVNEGEGEVNTVIVGLPDAAVRESRDRVGTAIVNSGFKWLQGRCTVNLAPADLKKEGPGFDLPIALGMIAVRELPKERRDFSSHCVVGELALNGALRPVKGILSIALEARQRGRSTLMVPKDNAVEASVVAGIEVVGVASLREAFECLTGRAPLLPEPHRSIEDFRQETVHDVDFSDVKGQHLVKRAAEVAAAGGHNMLFVGPPGTGKSMIAKRLATILPALSEEEAIETTKIHSICGLLDSRCSFVSTRPFRSPHHTISDAGLLGGGSSPGPGEVSLAHNGVLFLDELPEFRRSTLEVLRQPLEDAKVTISRAVGTMTFPSRFMLVGAMNPCPCGYAGDLKRECRCSPLLIQRYRQRISGPLLDRIDLHVEVPLVEFRELSRQDGGETSATIRQRVEQARSIQQERFRRARGITCNAAMSAKLLRQHCEIDAESRGLLENAMHQLGLSARAHDRILKVARTLADLAGADKIRANDILEAVSYRTLDRNLLSM
ncbi:MAG: YifB family Mg chelatase-like AAA ATPase [Verrucomicrobiales bacterium]|nr:YifB family Mg chelatase-like AAA ATPase [Verrucomicrobiales bacterium]